MAMLLYLKIEQYIADWYAYQSHQVPCQPKRGSAESDILEIYLAKPSKDRLGEVKPKDANLTIALPAFKYKDTRYYNYLPPKGRKALRRCLMVRFRSQLWSDLFHRIGKGKQISDLIWDWMIENGISDEPSNFYAIKQMFYRQRKKYEKIATTLE